jgi:hypothetical protein
VVSSQSFAKLYYVLDFFFFFFQNSLDAHRSRGTSYNNNFYAMSDFTPPNGTPKDINNRLGVVKGLDPGDPNDTAFKLVTILCFFVVSTKLSFFPFFL